MSSLFCSKAVIIVGASILIATIQMDSIKSLASENTVVTDRTASEVDNTQELLNWKPFNKEMPLGKSVSEVKTLYNDLNKQYFEYKQMTLNAEYIGDTKHTEKSISLWGIGDDTCDDCKIFGFKCSFNRQFKSLEELHLILGESLDIQRDGHTNYIWETDEYTIMASYNDSGSLKDLAVLNKELCKSYYDKIIADNFNEDTAIKPEQLNSLYNEYLNGYKKQIFGDMLEWTIPPTVKLTAENKDLVSSIVPEIRCKVDGVENTIILGETSIDEIYLGNDYFTVNSKEIKRKDSNSSSLELCINHKDTDDTTICIDEIRNFDNSDETIVGNESNKNNIVNSIIFEYADEKPEKYELSAIPAGTNINSIINKLGEPLNTGDEYVWKINGITIYIKADEQTSLIEYVKLEK